MMIKDILFYSAMAVILAVASSGTVLSGVTGTNPAFTATPSLTSLTITGSGVSVGSLDITLNQVVTELGISVVYATDT